MRAILLLVGASQALRPTLPPRHKTALNAFTNPFAKRPEELQELEPYETAPLFGDPSATSHEEFQFCVVEFQLANAKRTQI